MRCLLFVVVLLLCATDAHADSLADLRQPSSTIAGCINDWGPFGTGAGVVDPTCEGKAVFAEWHRHAAALYAARDVLVRASDLPLDRTDPHAVIDALNTCGAGPMSWPDSPISNSREQANSLPCSPGCSPGSRARSSLLRG